MALLDHVYAARGMVKVWLLGTILIWGVRKAKVQIPIQLTGRHKKAFVPHIKKRPYCVCGRMSRPFTF